MFFFPPLPTLQRSNLFNTSQNKGKRGQVSPQKGRIIFSLKGAGKEVREAEPIRVGRVGLKTTVNLGGAREFERAQPLRAGGWEEKQKLKNGRKGGKQNPPNKVRDWGHQPPRAGRVGSRTLFNFAFLKSP